MNNCDRLDTSRYNLYRRTDLRSHRAGTTNHSSLICFSC